MTSIRIDTAVQLSGISRRTWWRRISEARSDAASSTKGRTLIDIAQVRAEAGLDFSEDDWLLVVQADAGDPDAQNGVGLILHERGRREAGAYFIRLAAEQGHADSMQWLGRAYAGGFGIEKDSNLAISWLARAAAAGHCIAKSQVEAILRVSP